MIRDITEHDKETGVIKCKSLEKEESTSVNLRDIVQIRFTPLSEQFLLFIMISYLYLL